jgi:hypothetical protein
MWPRQWWHIRSVDMVKTVCGLSGLLGYLWCNSGFNTSIDNVGGSSATIQRNPLRILSSNVCSSYSLHCLWFDVYPPYVGYGLPHRAPNIESQPLYSLLTGIALNIVLSWPILKKGSQTPVSTLTKQNKHLSCFQPQTLHIIGKLLKRSFKCSRIR